MKRIFFYMLKSMLFLLVIACISCSKEKTFQINITDGAFIINEGAYGKSNSSVDFYNDSSNILVNDIFTRVNDRSLGDVLQSICLDSNHVFLIVNASNKIEVVSRKNFEEVSEIEGVSLPRYMVIRDGKGYVTCWGDSSLKILDLNSFQIIKSIKLGTGPEKMLIAGNKLFVANSGMYGIDSTISVVDLTTETLTGSIVAGFNPKDLKIDKHSDLWVVCYGKEIYDDHFTLIDSSASELVKIDINSFEIKQRITISETQHASILGINPEGSILYFGGGFSFGVIYKMSVDHSDATPSKFCEDFAYGFSVNPVNGELFVTLAPSFSDAGELKRYSSEGSLLGTYVTGIGPNGAVFNF